MAVDAGESRAGQRRKRYEEIAEHLELLIFSGQLSVGDRIASERELMLRFGQAAEIFTWGINFLLLAVSGVFNPVEALPGPLQPLARVLPTTHVFDAARHVVAGEPVPWAQLAEGSIGAVIAVALGFTFVVRMLGTFRRRGFVTRFS